MLKLILENDDVYIENSKRLLNLSPSFNNFENDKSDPYSYWSFFGLAPPPIKEVITYDELIEKINNNDPITDLSVNNLDMKMYYKLEYDNLMTNYESRDIIVSNRLGTTIL